jgi:putative tricarboxylic transport membrane protein
MVFKKNLGFYTALVLLLFSIFMFWQSLSYKYYTSFGPGPGLLPRWLNGALIVLSLIYLFQSVKKDIVIASDVLPKGKVLKEVLLYPASLILFIVIVKFTGFIIAGTALLFMLLVKEYKWYVAFGISLVTTGILFFAFKTLLLVPLPVNNFGF